MARGTEIVLSGQPKGTFMEGVIGDTSKPGTIMHVKASTKMSSGEPTWVAGTGAANGVPAMVAILTPDSLQGGLATQAYVSGTRCFLYVPAPGEDVNVLVGEGAGTANTFSIGDKLMLDGTTGIAIPVSGTPGSIPFTVMEAEVQVTGSTLVWCRFNGN